MTNKELREKLEKYPDDAEVKRQMTNEYGTIEIEEVRLESNGSIIID